MSANVTGNDAYETFYQWQMDKGDGWENLHGQNKKDFKFTISPLDNGKQVRSSAVDIISGDSARTLYSEPVIMNCARSDGDYEVDWEGNKIIITGAEGSEKANGYVRVSDSNGKIIAVLTVDGEADLSDYLGKGYDLRLFLWNDDMIPLTQPFEG